MSCLLNVASLAALWVAAPSDDVASHLPLSTANVRAHIDFLADDLLEGRDSGFEGSEIAALYIETWFRTHGIRPLLDTYRMEVPIPGAAGDGEATLIVADLTHQSRGSIRPLSSSAVGSFQAPLVTSDGDIAGKLLLLPGGDNDKKARELLDEALDAGAIGVLFISSKDTFDDPERTDPRRRFRRSGSTSQGTGRAGGYLPLEETSAAVDDVATGCAVRVSRTLGAKLVEWAEAGAPAKIEITREGSDRTTNVLGIIEGTDPALKDEYVIVGAHYDHVGQDAHGAIWNGADDNASGTAAVLEMAAALSSGKAPRRSMVLALWGAEERGLFGSREFAKQAPLPFEDIVAYINLDMISRNDVDSVQVVHASDDLFALAKVTSKQHGLAVQEGFPFFLQSSDTEPFLKKDVPTAFFFTGLHEDYHQESDDPPTADADKAARVARAAFDLAIEVADAQARVSFTSPSQRGGSFRAQDRRLGIFLADALEGDLGVRVRSVAPKSVAGEAGVLGGDMVLRIAGLPVRSLSELRQAIRTPKDDELFDIELLRGDGAASTRITVQGEFPSKGP